jgi:hypothetical protein
MGIRVTKLLLVLVVWLLLLLFPEEEVEVEFRASEDASPRGIPAQKRLSGQP